MPQTSEDIISKPEQSLSRVSRAFYIGTMLRSEWMAIKTSCIAVLAACLCVSSAFAAADDATIQGDRFLHREGGCRGTLAS